MTNFHFTRRRVRRFATAGWVAAVGLAAVVPTASAFELNVNFQPASSTAPDGFLPDSGQAYSDSPTYGWVREDSLGSSPRVPLNIADRTRLRTEAGFSLEQRTLVHMNAV